MIDRPWVRLGALLYFVVIPTSIAAAAPSQPRVAGIYSNLEYNEGGGDVLGIEVLLMPTVKGWYAVVQQAEGEPSVPVVVPAIVKADRVTFQLPEGAMFAGRVTVRGLEGEWVSNLSHRRLVLRRGRSYWQ
jgi:hypothetical protein